jgi:6-phosphogluconate dehydrogenase
MKIGLVGLGRMGGNMVRRLVQAGHDVVGYDLDDRNVAAAAEAGAQGVHSLAELVRALPRPRAVWVMVPHGKPTTDTIEALLPSLEPDDILVDGGNSHYTESIAHAETSAREGVHFLDIGVSGGVWGLEIGYCMMIGGPEDAFRRIEPILRDLAPEDGYARVGPSGSGHFVKMIHNAIEYGMLQAIGEGFECLSESDWDLDLTQVARVWRHGSVIRCWLLDLLEDAFKQDGNELKGVGPWVDDSGTGRWTVDYALEKGLPIPVITDALFERFASRRDNRFSYRTIAALRNQFGGHAIKKG